MKVSVIVPLYNEGRHIDKLYEDLCNQTLKDFEVVFVDDGSKDNSFAKAQNIAQSDNRVKVIHQENKGVSCARNNGIEHSSGDYIMFIDGDDRLPHNAIQSLYEVAIKTKADIVQACIGEDSRNDNSESMITSTEAIPYIINGGINLQKNDTSNIPVPIKKSFRGPYGKLFRKDVIGMNRFPEGIALGEDLIFVLKIVIKKINIALLNKCVYYAENNIQSSTRKYNTNLIESSILFYYKLNEIFDNNPELNKYQYEKSDINYSTIDLVLNNVYFNPRSPLNLIQAYTQYKRFLCRPEVKNIIIQAYYLKKKKKFNYNMKRTLGIFLLYKRMYLLWFIIRFTLRKIKQIVIG